MKKPKKRSANQLPVSEDLESIAEAKAHIWKKIRELGDRARPFTVNQNGKAVAVKFTPEDYERMTYEFRVLTGIYEGLEDEEAGRVYTDEELTRLLEADEASDPKPSRPKSQRKADSRGRTRRTGTSKGKASKRGA